MNGERTTWIIEAGKVGNEKPIQIVRDVWTSPDLLLTVLSRDADPRSGETSYRLKNVKRGEPDAALMKVPADYSQLGHLLIWQLILGLALPFLAILFAKVTRFKSA